MNQSQIQEKADKINAYAAFVKQSEIAFAANEFLSEKEFPSDLELIKSYRTINLKYMSQSQLEEFEELITNQYEFTDPAGGSGLFSHI